MEAKINIAKILKNKPEGTKLWTDMFGKVTLYVVTDKCDAFQVKHHNKEPWFDKDGKLCKEGVLCIYPSKSMRNWEKFAWKKCDMLVSNDEKREVLFKTWANDSYTKFVGLHCLIINDNEEVEYDNGTTVFNTNDFKGIDAEDAAQTYISTIEEKLGGKLNRETLEVEKPQPEFKDGDIAFADFGKTQDVFIVSGKTNLPEGYYSFIVLNLNSTKALSIGYKTSFFKENLNTLRLATKEEKQQLFDALAKEGKALPDMKKMMDLLKKCEFKPIDWCLMRGGKEHFVSDWTLCQFSHKMECGKYRAVGGCAYDECIPYNDQTKHLLGTTDEWKGGEQ